MIRVSQLCGRTVRRENSERLGHVDEIHVHDGEVTTLTYGWRGLLQRFLASRGGHRIAWEDVIKITASDIIVKDKVAKGAKRGT